VTISEGDDQIPRAQTPVGRSGSPHSIATDVIYNHRLFPDSVPSETDFREKSLHYLKNEFVSGQNAQPFRLSDRPEC